MIIDHELVTTTADWVENLKRTFKNIFEKNRKKNLFQNFCDEIDLIRKNDGDEKMIVAMMSTLMDMGLRVIIHDGSLFPALEPEILGNGTYNYHFLRFEQKLFAVNIGSY